MSKTRTVWQYSMGVSEWRDAVNFLEETKNIEPKDFICWRVTAKYKHLPQLNDFVLATCRAKLLFKGFVVKVVGEKYFVRITSVVDERPKLKGYRKNWQILHDEALTRVKDEGMLSDVEETTQ